jgi:hypothetical protein
MWEETDVEKGWNDGKNKVEPSTSTSTVHAVLQNLLGTEVISDDTDEKMALRDL